MSALPPLRQAAARGFSLARLYLPTGPIWDSTLTFLSAWNALGYLPRIDAPRSFNEHVLNQKKRFTTNLELARQLSDKYILKEWLNENGYGHLAIPTLGIYTDVKQLAGTRMNGSTILKPTHLSGPVLFVNSPRSLTDAELSMMNQWLRLDYYKYKREPTYKNMRKRIMHEPLLLDENGNIPADYKIFCFHGHPFMIQVDQERFSGHKQQLYSVAWELLEFGIRYPRHPDPIARPQVLEQGLAVASELSKNFEFCRVDFYFLPEESIKIGELTFFPHSGEGQFSPERADFDLGTEMARLANRREEGGGEQFVVSPESKSRGS